MCAALAVTEDLHARQQDQARLAAERAVQEAERATQKARQDGAKAAKDRTSADQKPREPRASTTDAEARVMKMADGGFRPAYNVQFAADTESGAIAGVSVDSIGSDMGKMAPMSDALAKQYDELPRPTPCRRRFRQARRHRDAGPARRRGLRAGTEATRSRPRSACAVPR